MLTKINFVPRSSAFWTSFLTSVYYINTRWARCLLSSMCFVLCTPNEIVLLHWSWQCGFLPMIHHYGALLSTEKLALLFFNYLMSYKKDLDVNLCLLFSLMHNTRHVVKWVILKNCQVLPQAFSWYNPRNHDAVPSRAGECVISCPCYNFENRFPRLHFDKSVAL